MRRRVLLLAVAMLVALAIVLLAVRPTIVSGYRVIDEYNIAVQVLGANPMWRGITEQTETASKVTLKISEIGRPQLGPGFGDEQIAYVLVTLRDPLAGREVIDASTRLAIRSIAQ